MSETVKLTRDITAIEVPFGTSTLLPKDTEVTITQSLGGSYTVTASGNMYQINNQDIDALGKTDPPVTPTTHEDAPLENKIWALLRTCYDPEIPVNIVDLGLIYGIDIHPADENKFKINIRMTLTAPTCAMGPIITAGAKQKVLTLPEVTEVTIEIVFDPPWDRSMMSDQAKLELGLF